MRLTEASKNRKQVKCIKCTKFYDLNGFASISFLFKDGSSLSFGVDQDTDEIMYQKIDASQCDLSLVLPEIKKIYGLFLAWSWEMTNQQGYFDAIQMEFLDPSLAQCVVLQLKVEASMIGVYAVEKMLAAAAGSAPPKCPKYLR
jgi:hypothetical protein